MAAIKKKTEFRKPYMHYPRVQIAFLDEDGNQAIGRTEQSHKIQCDMTNILQQRDRTGMITHVNAATARYGDYTEVNEFKQSMDLVLQAQEDFMALPSNIRERFHNNPGAFFEFATNPKNQDEMIALGLATKKAVPGESEASPSTAPKAEKPAKKEAE
jgi:phage internal scaffolding protein